MLNILLSICATEREKPIWKQEKKRNKMLKWFLSRHSNSFANSLTFDPALSAHTIHPVVFVAPAGLGAIQVNTQLIAHISLQAWIDL